MDYVQYFTNVDKVVMYYCDGSGIPLDARKIDIRHWILYKWDWNATKHVCELLRVIDGEGIISNYYESVDVDDSLRLFDNILQGCHVDFNMIAQILVDEYQYGMSLERVVDRFKDVDTVFFPSTLFIKAVRYVVNEWEAVRRYVNNG